MPGGPGASAPFGKNLKNRFYDLCPEGITLHLRFPYSVVCALFCMPLAASSDTTPLRRVSTFERAMKLLATISGREEYTDPGEKFESICMLLFQPETGDATNPPWVKLFDVRTGEVISEDEYYLLVRNLYNRRNPHHSVGDDSIGLEADE